MHDRARLVRFDHADPGGDAPRLQRFDRGYVAGADMAPGQMQPDGSLLCDGDVCRPGVYVYQKPDGTVVRELLPEEEAHNPASLETLKGVVMLNDHPADGRLVNADNVGNLGVGDVRDSVTVTDEGRVRVKLRVRRGDAIAAIRRGKIQLSPGYTMRLDPTPGVHPIFGAYDAIQRDRRYNHVAIVDRARGGPDMHLRADSAIEINPSQDRYMKPSLVQLLALLGVTRFDDENAALQQGLTCATDMKAAHDTAVAGLAAAPKMDDMATKAARIAELETELAALKASAGAAQAGAVDAAGAMVVKALDTDAPADMATAAPEEVKMDGLRKLVRTRGADRAKLEDAAASLRLDGAEVAAMGDKALRKKVVLTINPAARADAEDAYYAARFDAWSEGSATRVDAADPYAALASESARNIETAAAKKAREERADAADPAKPIGAAASLAAIEAARVARMGA